MLELNLFHELATPGRECSGREWRTPTGGVIRHVRASGARWGPHRYPDLYAQHTVKTGDLKIHLVSAFQVSANCETEEKTISGGSKEPLEFQTVSAFDILI